MKKSRLARLRATALRRFRRMTREASLTRVAPHLWEAYVYAEHEEGWGSTSWTLDMRTTPFEWSCFSDGVDCDGRMTHGEQGHYDPSQRTGFNNCYHGVWKPERKRGRFVADERNQRDYSAEAMGY